MRRFKRGCSCRCRRACCYGYGFCCVLYCTACSSQMLGWLMLNVQLERGTDVCILLCSARCFLTSCGTTVGTSHYYDNRLADSLLALLQVKKAKNFQAGMQMIRQLYFGAMDMHLHSNTYNPNGDKTVFQVLFCAYLRICVWLCLCASRGYLGYSVGGLSYAVC
jgi:hypothetical protein